MTEVPCTPRLLLQPVTDGYQLLLKATWERIGELRLDDHQALNWLQIEPGWRRQGLATEVWQWLAARSGDAGPSHRQPHEQTQSLEPRSADAEAWLTSIGLKGHCDDATFRQEALDLQRKNVEQWRQTLNIGSDYSKHRHLPRVLEPDRLAECGSDCFQRSLYLTPQAGRAWASMRDAAQGDQITLEPVSGFRSIDYQGRLIQRRLATGQTLEHILSVSAAPGYSEHHSGCALDLNTPGSAPLEDTFASTPAFQWLLDNAPRFGFRLSYPTDNPHQLAFEPWHWCHAESLPQ